MRRAVAVRVVDAGPAIVVLGPADGDPGPELVDALAGALDASGADAACRVDPVTDALVVVDGEERVRRHLDRSGHARIGLPQVLSRAWWERLGADPGAGGASGPAAAVLALGGEVAVLPSALVAGLGGPR